MYDTNKTRQASRISRRKTTVSPSRNDTVVIESSMLRSGSVIYRMPTKNMRKVN